MSLAPLEGPREGTTEVTRGRGYILMENVAGTDVSCPPPRVPPSSRINTDTVVSPCLPGADLKLRVPSGDRKGSSSKR